ncbi:hypothetical protein ACFYO0_14585 [Streptomyces sp. NPDC006365]|uniref:hypothetical protein n=1 Tax=Streptomyces sp. NPDC006365 TaxID=3364744 RepID=UPI0036C984F5
MHKRTLARHRLDSSGWAHPYGHGPFAPFLYADGGDGDGSESGSAGGDSATAGQQPAPPVSDSGSGTGDGQDVKSLPEWAQKLITDARAEAGKARTVAKQNAANEARQQLTQDIGKALGLIEGDKAPTPEELTEQLRQSHGALTKAQEEAASSAIELHVYKTAQRLGADADALLDSRAFCDQIDAIDPGSDTAAFSAAVEQAIQAALGRNPGLRARGVGRSGADLSGGSGDQATSLDKELAQAKADGNWRRVMQLENSKLAAAEAAQQ